MLKKVSSILTAGLLALGISVVAAPTASAYASNAGAASAEYEFQVTMDANGNFTVPANAKRISVNVNNILSSQNAATFSGQALSFTAALKDPNNTVVTDSAVKQLSPSATFYISANWSATGLNGYALNTSTTIGANNTSLSAYINASIQTFDGTFIPAGNYQLTYEILKNGTPYTLDNNDTINRYPWITLGGTSFTNPSGLPNNMVPKVSVATCIDRSLVTASDTLTLHPIVTSTGNVSSQETRFFQGLSMGQSTLLSNTSTLALSSVDLTKAISVGLTASIDTTAGAVTSADLSVTKGDGTEVTQDCTPQTPAAPTVSFSTSTNLRATFTVSSASNMPRCLLYLASDLNTVVRQTGGMPDSNRLVTCNFSQRTANTNYVVKVQEYLDFYYYESNPYFNIYRTYPSALSQASAVISSEGIQSSNNQNAQPSAQELAYEAERVRQVAIAQAKVILIDLLKVDKPGTLQQYRAANYIVNNEKVVEKVNASVLKLAIEDRSNATKIEAIVKLENFIDQVSTPLTQKTVNSQDLVDLGLVEKTNKNKASIANKLKKIDAASLNTIEKIQEAIAAELKVFAARADRTAAIKAKIAERNK